MSKGRNERANESGEKYLKGRTAGVEGTHGTPRKGIAEKTVIGSGDQSDGGTLDPALRSAAKSMYDRAVAAPEDGSKMGDQALRDR